MHRINKRLLNVLARKLQRKRPLGNSRYRWEENNEMDLKEIGTNNGLL
jgi:hypothetical protein